MGGQLIIISKVQYVTSINFNMNFNIPICIFLPKNYNFLLSYHVNSFLELNLNSINICCCRCFPNPNISFHLVLDIPIWMSQPHFEASVRMRLTFPKMGTWNPPGLLQLQNSITEVKTPCLEVFFISLERPWSLDVENGLAWAIWTSVA